MLVQPGDEDKQEEPDNRRAEQERIDPVQHSAVARQHRAHVLDPQIPLHHGLSQVPEGGCGEHCRADQDALPDRAAEQG